MLRGRNEHANRWVITVITLYGIKNCDTVRKARKWMDAQNIEYTFHDFREDGLDPDAAKSWIAELGWQNLVNRRSTSWKSLSEQARDSMDDDAALQAVLAQPTLIKRPVLDTGQQRYTGFSAASYVKIFNAHTL
jgi:arsenate reductase (glutaredoxin)